MDPFILSRHGTVSLLVGPPPPISASPTLLDKVLVTVVVTLGFRVPNELAQRSRATVNRKSANARAVSRVLGP